MLRTTISRLKKVCSVAFIPRLLRGDQRCAPNKVEIFSYGVTKKAPKSTKSTDDGDPESKKVTHKDENEFLFVPEKEAKLTEKNVNETETSESTENLKESLVPIVPTATLRESHSEKCQKIIDQAFGKEEIEPILGEQYYSAAAINIDETRRAITKSELAKLQYTRDGTQEKPLTDERVQFGVLKSQDLNKDEASTEPEEFFMNDNFSRATAIAKTEKLPESQPIDELSFLNKSLRVLPTEEDNSSDLSERARNAQAEVMKQKKIMPPDYININILRSGSFAIDNNFGTKDSKLENTEPENIEPLKDAKQDINVYISNQEDLDTKDEGHVQTVAENPSNPASESGTKLDDAQVQASSTIGEMDEAHHCNIGPAHSVFGNTLSQTVDCKVDAQDYFVRKKKPSEPGAAKGGSEVLEHVNLNWNEDKVNATTAKEEEEGLAQRLEFLEETPIVEAQNPKLEGFNVTPRVLGNAEDKIKNFTDSKRETPDGSTGIEPGSSYDEVAKRCLDTPTSQIDEILLKEMEKLGIPITGTRDSGMRSPVIENDLVQMDVLKKPRKPVETKELDLESREYERGVVDLCEHKGGELHYPMRYMCKESVLPDKDEETQRELIEVIRREHAFSKKIEEDKPEPMHPNQVLIDPYDKKTIAYDTGEYNPNEWYDPKRKYSYIYVPSKKNYQENQNDETVATKSAKLDEIEEEITSKPPTMTAGNNAWFNKNTQRDADNNFSVKDAVLSERELILQTIANAEPHQQNEKSFPSNYNYTNMNVPSGFWQNSYNQAGNQDLKSHKGQSQYDYANMNQTGIWNSTMPYYSQQTYQSGSAPTFNYDYSKNPYMQQQNAFIKAQEALNADFANMYASKGIGKSETQSLPLPATQSAPPWAPMKEILAEKITTKANSPYYDYSDMNTSENVVNMKQDTTESPLNQSNMKTEVNMNDVKQNLKDNLSLKVKPIPLPPPTFKIYSNIYRAQNKTQYRSRARPPKPLPLTAKEKENLTGPELLHSYVQAEKIFAEKIERAVKGKSSKPADDWKKIPLDTPPELVTHEHIRDMPVKPERVIEVLIPETRTSATVFANYKYCTNTDKSDDVWDELDPQSTTRLAQIIYAKVIEDDFTNPLLNISQEKKPAPSRPPPETPEKKAAEDLWETERLDPNHVLTCNETCPIALRPPSIKVCETSRLEAIFEGDFAKADLLNYSPEPQPELETPEGSGSARQARSEVTNLMHANVNPMVKERRSARATAPLPESIPSAFPPPSYSRPPTPADATPRPARPRLPDLSEDVSLSELLRRVRERSRMLESQEKELKNCSAVDVQPAVGKCPRRGPRCPPLAPRSPPSNPVPPPSFGLPPLKPRPRSCPPRKKKPKSHKFSTCDMDLSSGLCLGNHATVTCPEMICEMNDVGTIDLAHTGKIPVADLTEEVIERLHNLGKLLEGLRRGSKLMLARDYEPWSPIPSWPLKKPPPRKISRCEPGCKSYPPPRTTHDPPCDPKPCEGFPRKTFSMLDCLAVSLGDHKVYDLGEF